jgi:hypothetical protein
VLPACCSPAAFASSKLIRTPFCVVLSTFTKVGKALPLIPELRPENKYANPAEPTHLPSEDLLSSYGCSVNLPTGRVEPTHCPTSTHPAGCRPLQLPLSDFLYCCRVWDLCDAVRSFERVVNCAPLIFVVHCSIEAGAVVI